MIFFIAFLLCIPTANWFIGNIGTICITSGPCLIPVGFGLMAPSGVVFIGLALVLRDVLQIQLGRKWVFIAIACGTILSWIISSPYLAMASAVAFLLSEISDFMVFSPLQRKNLYFAVFASGLIGAIVDSYVFLMIAFGSLEFLYGQIVGKVLASLMALPVLFLLRKKLHESA